MHKIIGCAEQYERTRISRGRAPASPKFRSQQFEKSCAGQRTKRKTRGGYTRKTPKKGIAKKGVNGLVVSRRSEATQATHTHKRMRKNAKEQAPSMRDPSRIQLLLREHVTGSRVGKGGRGIKGNRGRERASATTTSAE